MDRLVDVAGHARLVLLDPPPSIARAAGRRLDPYPLVATSRATIEAGAMDVVLEAVPAAEPAPTFLERLGDTGDRLLTAWDGASLHLLAGGSSCELPRIAESGPLRFRYRPGFPVWSILGSVLGPVLHGAIREGDGVVVHGSAVEVDGEAVLVAGWSESGKTETALALAVDGSPLLSDKWTVIGPGRTRRQVSGSAGVGSAGAGSSEVDVLPFPSPLSIRRWLVQALPELRSVLPAAARLQFVGAALASSAAATAGLRDRAGDGPVSGLALGALERTLALGERTSLSMGRLRASGFAAASPTRERRLRAVVLLTALPPEQDDESIRTRPVDRRWAAARLARSAQAERRTWNDLLGRMAYARQRRAADRGSLPFASDPGRAELWQPDAVRVAEEERLAWLLDGVPIVEIAAPFPGDPRRVAAAVRTALSEIARASDTREPSDVGAAAPEAPAAAPEARATAPAPASAVSSVRVPHMGEVA